MNTAIDTITARKRDARFWQYVALTLVAIFTGITLYREISPRTQPTNVLVLDQDDYRLAKLKSFPEADELHRNQAEIATLCLFQRSPAGLDYENRLMKLFAKSSFAEAKELADSEDAEFQLKSLHQKVEISEISILRVRGDSVLTSVNGQLIRTGNFEGEPFTESLRLTLKIEFVRNPNMAENRFYPSIVKRFEATTTPIPPR